MKTKILTSILIGVLVTCFVSAGFATDANGNGAGLERVPVFIGFRQTPGPSEQALVRAHGGAIKYSYTLVPAIAASIPEPAIQGLMRNPNVTYIEPIIKVYAVDTELDNSWGVKHIGAGTVHDSGNKGTDVKVAIIDSGIDHTHPDLDDNYVGGWDFVNNDDDPMDDAGHGTHVAGTVAAEDNGVGVVGVAPKASLYAYKVLNASGSGDYSDIIAAMQQCIDDGIQVANLSLGSSGDPGETVKAAFDKAEAAGIVIVAAAGNSGNRRGTGDNVIYPARYESCIAVAATDSSNKRAYFSSTGPAVELAAPGVGINSTVPGGGYESWSGTSMACPHVTGTVALMMSGSGYSRETLWSTADDLGVTGWDSQYGYGLVDADEAAGTSSPPENTAPVANGDSASTNEDASVNIYVLANDLDVDEDALKITNLSQPGNGTAVLNADQTVVTYTPDLNFYGTDSFTYTANDGKANSNIATVDITVDPVNDNPVAVAGPDQSVLVGETVHFDGSGSYDPDGDNITCTWNFGDNFYSSDILTIHNYSTTGTYTVTLTVEDGAGLQSNDTAIVTVSDSSVVPTMHVSGIGMDWNIRYAGPNEFVGAVAIVTILDADNLAVEGADVYGSWSGATYELAYGVTDSSGQVLFSSSQIKNPPSGTAFTFTVTDVVKSGLVYESGDNVETSDSIIY